MYGKYVRVSSMSIFGGVGIGPQTAQLKRGVDIVVATPGRLLDHHGLGHLDLTRIETFVLDEADRMLDMGFIRDIKRVLALLPRKRQNLLFSATFPDEIRALADSLLDRPALIEVAPRNSTVEMIGQKVHPVDRDRKREMLAHLIGRHDWRQVLVFTRTKHGANKLAEQLDKDGITALAIHGNKSQGARTRALSEFKGGKLRVLVATDIAARGIDIDQLPHVVNYDLPNVPEDYVHRIGRTGRAGASGEAISLVCVDEHAFLRDIERLIRREIPQETIAGFEPDPHARAQPILQRQGRAQPSRVTPGHAGRGAGAGTHRTHAGAASAHGGRTRTGSSPDAAQPLAPGQRWARHPARAPVERKTGHAWRASAHHAGCAAGRRPRPRRARPGTRTPGARALRGPRGGCRPLPLAGSASAASASLSRASPRGRRRRGRLSSRHGNSRCGRLLTARVPTRTLPHFAHPPEDFMPTPAPHRRIPAMAAWPRYAVIGAALALAGCASMQAAMQTEYDATKQAFRNDDAAPRTQRLTLSGANEVPGREHHRDGQRRDHHQRRPQRARQRQGRRHRTPRPRTCTRAQRGSPAR